MKWRIKSDGYFWVVYSPDGKRAGASRNFKSAVAMVDCTPAVWFQWYGFRHAVERQLQELRER